MKATAQIEDLEFLSQILQQHLCQNISSGEMLAVKCAVKNDQLMILTQHPKSVTTDAQKVFTLLREVLESLSVYQTQKVQLYLRQIGEKLPYAKKDLIICTQLPEKNQNSLTKVEDLDIPTSTQTSTMFDSSSSLLHITGDVVAEKFDPLAGIPNFRDSQASKFKNNFKSNFNLAIFLLMGLLAAGIFGSIGYLLMSPCIFSTCQELQTAKSLEGRLQQIAGDLNSEVDLQLLKKQLDQNVISLQKIPTWSLHQQEISQIKANLISESEQITQMNQALAAATIAVKQSRGLTTNVEELKVRQQLWRKAIAPLETIRPDSTLYNFAQSKLSIYRSGLRAVNVQLLAQGKWQQKINDSQAVAKTAMQRESTAKTLPELQQAQATWQVVINALTGIPQTSPAYAEAQKLLAEYRPKLIAIRDRTVKLEQSTKNFTQAVTAAKLAEQYQQQNQWQQAANNWQQALNAIRQVPIESPFYNQALPLAEAYFVALKEAQTKSQSTTDINIDITHADLEKTCMGMIRVCNFTVDSRFINVRITPEYEQTLESNVTDASQGEQNDFTDVTKHLETLQNALEVIGDNANLAVLVFDAQGQQIFTHVPRRS
ncbi:hypothetical protein [Calothrix sp. UHCC 0171]|uniref:hypothetical protein n=1 Tax=Calothrix sp. UHCC 0171 TaxID=3110245 RepID=UPI002B20978C|nr:hypothetical protein [Calothrix sp. UHCC 0171]MEA5569896.1 hypothetical protein [Calothrix sp. UHCC 0171]